MAPLERGFIVPPFAERLHEINDGRTVNLGLDVVPRGARAERGVEHLSLRVAFMVLVVATPCTAPFMGTALGWAATQPAAIALAVFTARPALGRFLTRIGIGRLPEETAPPLALTALALPAVTAAARTA